MRLAAPKRYSLREAGGSLIVTIPKTALISLKMKKGSRVWLYATPSGDLLLAKKKRP
jgi:antitoxin component of MazEF toxin-antitoxin module